MVVEANIWTSICGFCDKPMQVDNFRTMAKNLETGDRKTRMIASICPLFPGEKTRKLSNRINRARKCIIDATMAQADGQK